MRGPVIHIHPSACVDDPAVLGAGVSVWHFSHVMAGCRIGAGTSIGQNCFVADGALIGRNVKIQNNVSVFKGVEIEDHVFLGPSCVLTNIKNPRAEINRRHLYVTTRIRRGATIGANATIVCGVTIGRYAMVGAGAVVTHDVPDYALVMGVPARQVGWVSRHGHNLGQLEGVGIATCPESGYRYRLASPGHLVCLDLDEEAPLPKAS